VSHLLPNGPTHEDCVAAVVPPQVLFGALIHHQLVTSFTLSIALRYVMDAVRKPPTSNMHRFAIDAIKQFRADLALWPEFCQQLLLVDHLRTSEPELFDYIERLVREVAAGKAPAGPTGDAVAVAAAAAAAATVGVTDLSSGFWHACVCEHMMLVASGTAHAQNY
jgi:CCR4-NOT transcription complex subunit 1 TTP binding domain